jgi:hypothetical protein
MKFFKTLILAFLFVVARTAVADVSCENHEKGNGAFSSGKFEDALNIYKRVESFDKYGKLQCTGASYATIATIYTLLGDKQMESNPVAAAELYKLASRYNRAFAYSVDCNLRSCENSKYFWDATIK